MRRDEKYLMRFKKSVSELIDIFDLSRFEWQDTKRNQFQKQFWNVLTKWFTDVEEAHTDILEDTDYILEKHRQVLGEFDKSRRDFEKKMRQLVNRR